MVPGYEAGRSKQSPFPFTREVTVDVIAAAGDKLWKELVGNNPAAPMKVTSVQLAFTGIEASEIGLQSIDGFFRNGQVSKRTREPDDRLGSVELDTGGADFSVDDTVDPSEDTQDTSFTCSRCGKRISLPTPPPTTDSDKVEALAALRLEHDDFHFAEDLAKENYRPISVGTQAPESASRVKKKRRKELTATGIEKFFSRK